MTPTQQANIAIVGSGLTALASAALLSRAEPSWRVMLITAPSFESNRDLVPKDVRTTALSASSLEIFTALGLYDDIRAQSAQIETIEVSDRGHSGLTRLKKGNSSFPLGLVIENSLLSAQLEALISRQDNIDRLTTTEFQAIKPNRKGFCLMLPNAEVNTHFLIAADGATSPVREHLGIRQHAHDYQQTALVATLILARPQEGVAYERFTSDGPVALLPLANTAEGEHRASLVWTLPNERAKELQTTLNERSGEHPQISSSAETYLLDQLGKAFGHRAGIIQGLSDTRFIPLHRKLSTELIRSHVALIGSAAYSLHPVAGQGFNLALRDIAALTENLLNAHRQGRSLGELKDLLLYLSSREQDQLRTVLLSDQLPRLFAKRSPLMILGRNLGLMGLNLSPMLRQAFTRNAAGLGTKQTRLDGHYASINTSGDSP